MVIYSLLKPCVFYRLKTPLIMPENTGNRKKNVLYSVLAPSIEDELNFIAGTKTLVFRNLYNYFIEKSTMYKLRGSGNKKVVNNKEGDITELLEKAKKHGKNLSKVNGVISFRPTNATNVLKDFNTLYEINHVVDTVINNPKDTRTVNLKMTEFLSAVEDVVKRIDSYKKGFEEYYDKYLIIPVNLWVESQDYKTTRIYTKTSNNYYGQLVRKFRENPKLVNQIFGTYRRIILVSDNNIMSIPTHIHDADDTIKHNETYFADYMESFLKKCKKAEIIENVLDDNEDSNADNAGLTNATIQTAKTITVDRILEKSKIDPDTVDHDKREALEKSVKVTTKGSEPTEVDGKKELAPVVTKIDDEITDDIGVAVDTSDLSVIKSANDVDVVVQAKLSGQSIENYRRNQMLKEKYKTLNIGSKPVEEIIQENEKYDIPPVQPKINTVNESLKTIKAYNFENAYNKELADYDFANILLHFSNVKPALYLVKDVKVEDISDTMNKLYKYTVVFEDETRKRHQFSFKMPKMYQDKYCFINEQKWNIVHQKVPFPVTKVGPNMCQIATNYNKIFMSRYGANISSRLTKLKKVLNDTKLPKGVSVVRGNVTKLNMAYMTTLELDELGAEFVSITTPDVIINLEINTNKKYAYPTKDPNKIPIGIAKDNKTTRPLFLDSTTNIVYINESSTNLELSSFIAKTMCQNDKKLAEEFASLSAGSKFTYTRGKVLGLDIPIILFLGAADPGGLLAVIERAKINYEFVTTRPSVDKDERGVIPFSDGWLVYDRYPYENSLLLNGLLSFPTKEFSFYDMGTRDTYVEIFDLLFNRRNLVDGIENFYYLLIDPITADVIRQTNLPDDFTGLVLYANGLLADNKFTIDSNYDQSRVRSTEIINAYLYRELCTAFAPFKDGRVEKFAIPEDAVIKDILESNIVDSHSKLNITLEAENDNQIKLKGPGGMNEDRSFTLEKRAYHPSMKGIVGMNSTPSGEVGIGRHMTINANIENARGFVDIGKDDYDGMELITPGEALQTFGPESADIERVAMAISQSKHVIPVEDTCAGLVTYDMERAIPYISNDFANKAKKDGKVVAIENNLMIVQYKDNTFDDIDLSEHPDKNTDGGFYVMNQLTTDFKVGETFKAGDILAYDRKYINTPSQDMFGDLTASVGALATVAIECSSNVYEDSCYITDKLAHRLTTHLTQEKNVILTKFANIKYIVKKGTHVKANDPLMTFDDTADEFASQLLASMAEEAEDSDEVIATTAPVITKVTGIVKDIKIYYTVPLEEMTPSLRKIVESYNKENAARERTIAKYMDPKDANTILNPAKQVIPDSTGRVKGVKVGEGILIEFYIEYEDVMGVGDKLT